MTATLPPATTKAAMSSAAPLGDLQWKRVERDQLDLVVVDEAGSSRFRPGTMAVAMAGHGLLLLGDPQRLPQVSQGSHPDPVDLSALGC